MEKTCTIRELENAIEMDVDYSIIQQKVKEMNELGIDVTLQEVANIVDGKFFGRPTTADVRVKEDGSLWNRFITLIKDK